MFSLRTQEIMLLVKDRFEDFLGARVHIMAARPEEHEGWAVYIGSGGIVWKQSVSREGVLGSCSREYPQMELMGH